MKTNLLLLDTSKNMEPLIFSGFNLSNQQQRKLKISYVLDFNWMGSGAFIEPTGSNIDASLRVAEKTLRKDFEQARTEMQSIVAKYLELHPQNVPYELDVVENDRLSVVNKTIEEEKDVLLLMSNYNSYSGLDTGAINYPNIIDKVACPVLILPDDTPTAGINTYLYATAFHPEDFKAMRHLKELTEGLSQCSLTVFHNLESTNFESILKWTGFKTMTKESIEGFQLNFAHSHEKNVREGLKKYLEDEKPDVLVIMKETKGFLADLFSSSETHYVLTHFKRPVLVYHEENLK
ncbi:universal stress protein [uncultured Sunxiuqinia sp.]|uniref:universal stress protein n=1 Tax=uncultured Sunxiuqinia sp. TaxID=1573825 RepID=UPI0026386933|nr:universal stress protein [uncultured Sunxiuqinia sp.]